MSYIGQTLEVSTTLQRLNRAAHQQGFSAETLVEQVGTIIPVFRRSAKRPNSPRVYISTGIHGDEPAGPLTILDLLETEQFSQDIDWTLFPMLNPAGLRLNQRGNHEGIDLNRDYKTRETKEVRAHTHYIESSKPWDLALAIHEDWESEGFYLYDLPTELTNGWAQTIIESVSKVCPIDLGEHIDEMSALGGIISPDFETVLDHSKLAGHWPEPIYLHMTHKTRGTFTFETPSAYDLPTRIDASKIAILSCIDLILRSQ
jgi:murein peptide amidase A